MTVEHDLAGVFSAFLNEGERIGLTEEDFKRPPGMEAEFYLRKLAEAILNEAPPVITIHRVTVDSSMSFGDMIAAGRYTYVDEAVTEEHFSLPETSGPREVDLCRVRLRSSRQTLQVRGLLTELDFRQTSLREFCALGACHPELQMEFPIVSLGSSYRRPNGDVVYPELSVLAGQRSLDGNQFGDKNGWARNTCFLAVKK